MEKLNLEKSNLKKFGNTMGIACIVLALLVSFEHEQIASAPVIASGAFFIVALFIPFILKPIYIFWMRLAFVLSWFNTRLLLSVIFYLLFTPIALCLKLFRKDLLDRKIEKNKPSYWHKRESCMPRYERQF